VLQPAFPTREGRPPRRPPQCQHLSGLLSQPSGFSPVRLNTSNFQVCSLLPQVSVPLPQSPPTREGRPPRRPPQCRCRSTAFHLSSSAPLRLCASARAKALYGALIRHGRDDLRVVRLNAVAGAPYFIYPALRLCASARAKALYGALIPRGRDDLRVVRLNAVAGAPYFIYPAQRLCASQGTLWRINPTRQGRPPRRPKALLPQVSAPAAASTVPLTVLSQVSYRQISDLLNLTIHFVHFFLNKATGCVIHTVLVLRHSPDGALLNSSRSGNQFVAFSRLTNGGSVPSD